MRFERFDLEGALGGGTTVLEASAGTGKTYSIAHLVLRIVAEGPGCLPGLDGEVGIDRILVVTFTTAATAELRDRVRKRLRDALDALEGEPPRDALLAAFTDRLRRAGEADAARARLRRALQDFDAATIATIHGFCRRMLQANAFESGAEPDVALVADAADLVEEIARDFWIRETYAAPERLVRHLAARGCTVTTLARIARKVADEPDLELVWTSRRDAPPEDDGAWEAAVEALRACLAGADVAVALLHAGALDGRSYQRRYSDGNLELLRAWLDAGADPCDAPEKALAYFSPARLREKTKLNQDTPAHPLFERCAAVSETGEALVGALDAWLVGFRCRAAGHVRATLEARKATRRVQTYGDLLTRVRDAMREGPDAPLARRIREQFRVAVIDEFQDSDPVQWAVFSRVFHDVRLPLFLIGDPKQAIYKFRGADLNTYLEARDLAQRGFRLDVNHRSDRPLVEAVNRLFAGVAAPFVDARLRFEPCAARHERPRLHVGDGEAPPLVFRFVPDVPEALDARTKCLKKSWEGYARLVAGDVAAFLARDDAQIEGEDGRRRRVGPRDCAVLVRSNAQAAQMREALAALRVPAVLHGAGSVLASAEARELARVLTALAEPTRAALVKTALASPLFGLDAVALAGLDDDAWDEWLDRFRRWSALWRDEGFTRMFRAWSAEVGLAPRVLSFEGGERRMTNLLHLAELLHAAATDQALRPAALLCWLQDRRREAEEAASEDRQLRLETDEDAVEIVTIHASKGLEYAVVWCPYLWDAHPAKATDECLRVHDAASGRWLLDVDPANRPPERVVAAQFDEYEESLRLAYVALTRARHRCFVYWGRFNGAEQAALAYLLFGADQAAPDRADGDSLARLWQGLGAIGSDGLRAALDALAGESGGGIALEHVDPEATPPVWTSRAVGEAALAAAPFERATPIDDWWRWSSYTGLQGGGEAHDAAAAHGLVDERDIDEPAPPAPAAEPLPGDDQPVALAELTGSREIGKCLHKILELHDFRAPEALAEGVARQLTAFGLDAERWTAPVTAALDAALRTPLPGGAPPLGDVPRPERLNELDFVFPVAGGVDGAPGGAALTPKRLFEGFAGFARPTLPASYLGRLAGLRFGPPLRGFLKGSIDLVFRAGGRFYVVDYKSNCLRRPDAPSRQGDYAPPALQAEMARHHYPLQAHLYTVALHRFLTARVPGYDYDAHFGGVLYLFLRGMRPETGPARGVWFDLPPRAQIETLSATFAEVSP